MKQFPTHFFAYESHNSLTCVPRSPVHKDYGNLTWHCLFNIISNSAIEETYDCILSPSFIHTKPVMVNYLVLPNSHNEMSTPWFPELRNPCWRPFSLPTILLRLIRIWRCIASPNGLIKCNYAPQHSGISM